MTLYTTDYLEYYLTLVGWVVHNGLWNVLVASGVFALPFLAIIIQEWIKARNEGADEGNKGALSAIRIENRVWVAIVVILFAGIPFIDVDVSRIQYDLSRSKQCQVTVAKPSETGWDTVFTTINNQSAKVPVWWFFMHSLSRSVTSAAVASIPCGTDLRQMRMDIDNSRIDDPVLAQEVADFSHNCYGHSNKKVEGNYTLEAGQSITSKTKTYFMGGQDEVVIQGPGGKITISGAGIEIEGSIVIKGSMTQSGGTSSNSLSIDGTPAVQPIKTLSNCWLKTIQEGNALQPV